jgi:hypothetical protein
MNKERYKRICDYVSSLHRATASYQSQVEHAGHEYEVRRQVGINQKTNKYIPSEQFDHLKSESAVAERGMGYKHQEADLESADLDVAYDDTIQKMPSHTSFIYNKHRRENSHENKYNGFEQAKLDNSGVVNPEKSSVSLHYKIPRQRKFSTMYPENKQKQDLNLSFRTQFPSQRLKQPANRLGILNARTHSRMKKTPSSVTDSSKVQQNSSNQHGITYKVEGKSLKSWKPIHGHKITGSFKPRYEMTTSKPLNSEDALMYEVNRQDAEEEEESDHNITVHNADGEDDDEEYDDIKNGYDRKIQETDKSDGSNIGLQSIYQQKIDGVQRIRNQVPYSARIKDGARSYTRGSNSRSFENGADDNERTENIIQSRIEHLKESIKREMTRES